ncbi:N-acetylglucosamine related transporter, NagX [Fulvivirga imtechensis AK7]|uniref:N-acetylglucosamine related transporter, NagX n=1 Tax=Fulvivirga imtechensis AK7 TaxID=1237149 RepID=L8JLF5_9BACT|nr:DUF5009 domain-containing protein [Fulvivirga imtechensis]ELR68324.1 N-acetylglucosamine related transporter, NagX [Fulvivirga imtechensis AK7]
MNKNKRLLSLDVFRGITIAAMIVVNNPGSWAAVYPPLLHAGWHGCTLTDLVFPFFLFIVGVAVCLSLSRAVEDKGRHKQIIFTVLKRSVILFLIGLFLNAFPYFDLYHLRIPGVLQRIAVVFFICAFLYLKTGWKVQVYIGSAILMVYWLLFLIIPIPGAATGSLESGANLAAWVDSQLLTGHMWEVTKTWDPEGVLSTLPAIVTGIIGVLVGQWLMADRTEKEKVIYLFVAANLLIVAGLFWDLFFPINKSLWTSSYVLYTAGIAIHFLAFLYWLLDIKMQRSKFWTPFKAFGINAIFVYMLSMMLASVLVSLEVSGGVSLQGWLFSGFTAVITDVRLASFIYALLFTLLMFVPVWILYKKNIIIKV